MPKEVRADTVGSLLRPESIRRAKRGDDPAAVRAAEDAAVLDAIALQEAAGLDVITDGEMRRRSWVPTGDALSGFTLMPGGAGWRWQGTDRAERFDAMPYPFVTAPLRVEHDLAREEYAFLLEHAHTRTKFCLPAPSYHRTFWDPGHSAETYPRVEDFLTEIRDILRGFVETAVGLGCDYIQLDAPNYGFICDRDFRAQMAEAGRDLAGDLEFDTALDNSILEGLDGVTGALHICRGNAAGNWAASGGYDAVSADLFPRLRVDRLLLEYDTPRSGDFGALHDVREGTTVVLGLLTTKSGALEDADAVEARIHEAARIIPLDRLALSPQCGFASVASGNPTTPEEQEAKLRLVGRLARAVWDGGRARSRE